MIYFIIINYMLKFKFYIYIWTGLSVCLALLLQLEQGQTCPQWNRHCYSWWYFAYMNCIYIHSLYGLMFITGFQLIYTIQAGFYCRCSMRNFFIWPGALTLSTRWHHSGPYQTGGQTNRWLHHTGGSWSIPSVCALRHSLLSWLCPCLPLSAFQTPTAPQDL